MMDPQRRATGCCMWAGLLFHSGQQEKETIKLQTHRQETKKRKKREKNLPRVVTNVGDFCSFSRIRCCCCCCVFMYCDKLRILSRLFLSFPLTTRDLIFFEFIFFLSFYYHFGIEENLDANARGQRRTCDTQLLTETEKKQNKIVSFLFI